MIHEKDASKEQLMEMINKLEENIKKTDKLISVAPDGGMKDALIEMNKAMTDKINHYQALIEAK